MSEDHRRKARRVPVFKFATRTRENGISPSDVSRIQLNAPGLFAVSRRVVTPCVGLRAIHFALPLFD